MVAWASCWRRRRSSALSPRCLPLPGRHHHLAVLALPFTQLAFSYAQRIGHMPIGVPASTWSTASRLKDSGKRRLVWVMNTPYGGHYPP